MFSERSLPLGSWRRGRAVKCVYADDRPVQSPRKDSRVTTMDLLDGAAAESRRRCLAKLLVIEAREPSKMGYPAGRSDFGDRNVRFGPQQLPTRPVHTRLKSQLTRGFSHKLLQVFLQSAGRNAAGGRKLLQSQIAFGLRADQLDRLLHVARNRHLSPQVDGILARPGLRRRSEWGSSFKWAQNG